jgi:hypothetical protein
MSKFKVGDRVKVVGNNFKPHHHPTIGTEAEILELIGVDDVWVKGQGSYGAIRQYINTRDIELVPHPTKQKIVVTTDGKITTACLFYGKKMVKSAEAKCSPRDEFNFETGAALALDRLLDREKKTEPEKLFLLEDIKVGYLLKVRDDDGSEYFMTVLVDCDDELGCCHTDKHWWPLRRFGCELRYADSTITEIYGRTTNRYLLDNTTTDRKLLWSR